MKINIDHRKIGRFIYRHKEAIAVALLATAVIQRQSAELTSMEDFLYANRLDEAYCDFKQR
jgi:hypothetical protein